MPLLRKLGNAALSFLIKAASGQWHVFDPTNGYTAIHRAALAALSLERLHPRYFFESSMLIALRRIDAVVEDVPMPARYGGGVSHPSGGGAAAGVPPVPAPPRPPPPPLAELLGGFYPASP